MLAASLARSSSPAWASGLLISVISDSERQAVQLSLLVLLSSVFFSGFVLPVDEFRTGLQYAAYALPVTHGITAAAGRHAARRIVCLVAARAGTGRVWAVGAAHTDS
jgi:ABC-type multidrug transport system permease subunit